LCRAASKWRHIIDEFLNQIGLNFAQDSLNDMDDYDQNRFGPDGFGLSDAYNNHPSINLFNSNNLSLDPFSSNIGTGGQGSLAFPVHNGQQHVVTPPGLDQHSFFHNTEHTLDPRVIAPFGMNSHSSSQNPQYSHKQHQQLEPSSHNRQTSNQGAERFYDSSAMFTNGKVEDVAYPIEQGQDSREEDVEEDGIPVKIEDHDIDDEYMEEATEYMMEDTEDEAAEEDQDDGENDGSQQKKEKKKRRPYKQPRILTRWDSKFAYICCIIRWC
jgi:hypothetical protein